MKRNLILLVILTALLAACDRGALPNAQATLPSGIEVTEAQPAGTSIPAQVVTVTPVPTPAATAIPTTDGSGYAAGIEAAGEEDQSIDITPQRVTETEGLPQEHEGPLRVLFIGNSYTAYNDVPGEFAALMQAGGHPVEVRESVNGGWSLSMHLMHDETLDRIAEGGWDYVVLQEQSAVTNPEVVMYPAVRQLDQKIRGVGSETVLFMTWGRRDGLAAAGYPDYASLQTRITANYLAIAEELDLIVAPVGIAWRSALAADPDLDLWAGDGSHPSRQGAYLAACVFYAVMSGQSPEGLEYKAGLTDETARSLQRLAAETVAQEP